MDMNRRLQRIEMTVNVDPADMPPVEDTTQVALWLQAVAATKDLDAMRKAVENLRIVFEANLVARVAREQLLAEPIPDGICRE